MFNPNVIIGLDVWVPVTVDVAQSELLSSILVEYEALKEIPVCHETDVLLV